MNTREIGIFSFLFLFIQSPRLFIETTPSVDRKVTIQFVYKGEQM